MTSFQNKGFQLLEKLRKSFLIAYLCRLKKSIQLRNGGIRFPSNREKMATVLVGA